MMNQRMHVNSVVYSALLILLMFCSASGVYAQSYVYSNNDGFVNTVSAFSVAPNGALAPIAGSPFPTGGNGQNGGFFASNRATIGIVGNTLYVSNGGSNSVSALTINTATGALTTVPGSPFPTDGAAGAGISLAVTPDGKYLIAANSGSNNFTVYGIAANGALATIPESPFAAGLTPDGIKVTPDGKFLVVAAPFQDSVGVYSISSAGTLLAVAGSPFADGGPGSAAGVDVNCSSNFAFVGEASGNVAVDVFSIASSGALTAVPGSPFQPGAGNNSNVVLLSPDDKILFNSNQGSGTVTVFSVAADGSLAPVLGSPFPVPGGPFFPSGMGTTNNGQFLYTANGNHIGAFSVAGNGALTPVPGGPFPFGAPGLVLSLAVFPQKTCVITVGIDIKPGSDPNSINRRSRGNVPVALLSSATFDAATADRTTVMFADVSALNIGQGLEDVNGDGLLDRVFHFDTQRLNLPDGTTEACLIGNTTDGKSFKGCDAVRLVR